MENGKEVMEYLAFTLAGERYCIGVNRVREVVELSRVTRLPNTLEYMKGLINLRGAGIPVIDFKLKFKMPESEPTRDTSIIVMEVRSGESVTLVGAVADSVQEVIALSPDDIDSAPRFGARVSNDFIDGIGMQADSFLILLDIDKIFSREELSEIAGTPAA